MKRVYYAVAAAVPALAIALFFLRTPDVSVLSASSADIQAEPVQTGIQTDAQAVPANQPSVSAAASAHADHSSAFSTLPPELQAYIENQRLPAEKIPVINHGDGKASVIAGNQWSSVVMVVIDEHGNHQQVERQIQPIGTLEISQ